MLKSTALILLVALSLYVSSTTAKSVWAKRESNPVYSVNVPSEDIPNVINSDESEVSKTNESASDDSDDGEMDEEFLKDFLFVISKIIVIADESSESGEAEIEKVMADFERKHPGSEKFWQYFVTQMAELEDLSDEESSESASTNSKRSETVARFGRQAAQTNNLNELRKLF